jgi:hypothetical protein
MTMEIGKRDGVPAGNRQLTRGAAILITAMIVLLGLCVAIADLKGRRREADQPIDGPRVYRLSRLVDGCPDARPMLARALADDRITAVEADGIEHEGRRLWRISTDATFHNAARRSAGLARTPEPAECRIPYDLH